MVASGWRGNRPGEGHRGGASGRGIGEIGFASESGLETRSEMDKRSTGRRPGGDKTKTRVGYQLAVKLRQQATRLCTN